MTRQRLVTMAPLLGGIVTAIAFSALGAYDEPRLGQIGKHEDRFGLGFELLGLGRVAVQLLQCSLCGRNQCRVAAICNGRVGRAGLGQQEDWNHEDKPKVGDHFRSSCKVMSSVY